MIIKGVTLPDLEINDLAVAEKYDNLVEKTSKKINEANESKKRSQIIKGVCEAVFMFFDDLWGAGTAKQVFGEETNLLSCAEAYGEVIHAVHQKDKDDAEKIKSFMGKYSPNRAARRTKK